MAMTVTLDDLVLSDTPTGDPSWKVTDLDGWWSAPTVETGQDPIPLQDGNFEEDSYRRAKKWAIVGFVAASSPALARASAWQRLAGLSPVGGAMQVTVVDDLGTRTQRVRLDSAPQVQPFGGQRAFFRIPLIAHDPRKYGPTQTQQRGVGIPTATDGLNFPLFAPGYLDFGAFTGTNQVAIKNTGTAPTWATFAVSGGFDGAGFNIVSDAGDLLTFQRQVPTSSTVMLSPYAGGRATIDGSDQSVFLTSAQWAPIPPGGSRAYSLFPLGNADANAGMTVTYREAWW